MRAAKCSLSKWYLFLRKETILDTPLELTRRLAFARFMYHKQSKETAACEGGGQRCVPPPPIRRPPTRYLGPHGS